MTTLTDVSYKQTCNKLPLFPLNKRDNSHVANSLSQRYDQLLLSEKYYDCVFLLEEEAQRIKCHKLILALASPVFEAMFYGPLSATLQEKNGEIVIDDISATVFQLLMRYAYTGQAEHEQLSLEQSIELYYAAEKYLMSELSAESLKALQIKLRYDNILPTLELSVQYDLSSLREMCMNFFMRMCLGDKQYMQYLKHNYYHVHRDCMKTIIERALEMPENKQMHKTMLMEFVEEWCLREIDEDVLLKKNILLCKESLKLNNARSNSSTLERSYYKACRPFVVEHDAMEWRFKLKSNRFISLKGLIVHSRLTPNMTMPIVYPNEYYENLTLQIKAPRVGAGLGSTESARSGDNDAASNATSRNNVIWQQSFLKLSSKYNCDLNLQWSNDVIMSPDLEYEICLKWSSDAFGAEYPCSLQSNLQDGIEFVEEDITNSSGSIVKGLRYANLY